MIYVIAGACIVICIAVIIFGLKILKENRKMLPKKKNVEEDDGIRF